MLLIRVVQLIGVVGALSNRHDIRRKQPVPPTPCAHLRAQDRTWISISTSTSFTSTPSCFYCRGHLDYRSCREGRSAKGCDHRASHKSQHMGYYTLYA
eukprot:6192678-Pleurochrysis_carterae.AAC.3